MAAEENWQTELSTIAEKTAFIFNKELLSDVKFVVPMSTDEDEFVTVERAVVESVVKREVLNVTEVELFKAVNRGATKECERQGMTSDGETKRRILGEDIVKGIRFPLIPQKDFASVVFDSRILNLE